MPRPCATRRRDHLDRTTLAARTCALPRGRGRCRRHRRCAPLPRPRTAGARDPVRVRLRLVGCHAAGGGAGAHRSARPHHGPRGRGDGVDRNAVEHRRRRPSRRLRSRSGLVRDATRLGCGRRQRPPRRADRLRHDRLAFHPLGTPRRRAVQHRRRQLVGGVPIEGARLRPPGQRAAAPRRVRCRPGRLPGQRTRRAEPVGQSRRRRRVRRPATVPDR